MDVREAVIKQLGTLLLANIELNAQLQQTIAENEQLKAPKPEEKNDHDSQ